MLSNYRPDVASPRPDATSRKRRQLVVLAALLLLPLLVLQLRVAEPFLTPSVAATVATVLRDPFRYAGTRRRIARSYALAVAVAVPVSALGALLALPTVVTVAVAVVVALSSGRVRFHPPAVGLPLSVQTGQIVSVGISWSVIVLSTAYILLALVLVSRLLNPATTTPPLVRRWRPRWRWCWRRRWWAAPRRRPHAARRSR